MVKNQLKILPRKEILIPQTYPLLSKKERLLIWKKVKGMWKNRKPEPIQELKKIRKE